MAEAAIQTPLPGFADPARDSAIAFRAILEAMAQPGRIVELESLANAPEPLSISAASSLLTLADGDAGVWLAPSCASDEADAFLRFHCGVVPLTEPREAAFAVGQWEELSDFSRFAQGTDEYPDRAATLIIEVTRLSEGAGLTLSGPGIKTTAALNIDGADGLGEAMRANRKCFPLGVDVILTNGHHLAALPRSIHVEG